MIIVGGGSSSRFGSDKLLADVNGRPLITVTVDRVVPHVERCVLVVRPEMVERISALGLPISVVAGGSTRTLSEMAGLAAIGDTVELVGIHDAARPLVSAKLIDTLFETAEQVGGAVPVISADDLILDRRTHTSVTDLRRAQTPQVFRSEVLLAAYASAARAGFDGHDTVEVVERFSDIEIGAVPGHPSNIKVTYPSDIEEVRGASHI